jgi:hypothetical protein
MFVHISTLLVLLSLTFTDRAAGASISTTIKELKEVNGTCKYTDRFPTEEQYILGYNHFCDIYVNVKSKRYDNMHLIDQHVPLVATFDLKSYTGKAVRWVFKITCAGQQYCRINNAMCKKRLKMFYDSDETGGLGKAYCIVAGTEKKGPSGEGAVLVMDGKLDAGKFLDTPHEKGSLTYYTYERMVNS